MDGLLVPGHSPVHRLPAEVTIVALVLTVAVVVLTPAGRWGVLAGQAALVLALVPLARLPLRLVAGRMVVELPFVVFAVLLPVVASGPTTRVGPLELSVAGLVGAGTLLIKSSVGVLAAVVLGATTAPRDLLAGLERLRLPVVLVAVLSFMVRYLVLVGDDLHRVRLAREARGGGRPSLRAVAAGVGTRFVRTYERGERVQQAMLARGYRGRMPVLGRERATLAQWTTALSLPAAALVVAGTVAL